MKILKEGRQPSGSMTFRCSECGCVFEATDDEYTSHMDWHDFEITYVTHCPCCYKRVIER